MDIECFLNILGNETRREILQMLTERECYVSQISEELNIGQKAIIAHLEIMERAGLLEPHFEKIQKGRPRKYFHVTQNFNMEVNLLPSHFNIRVHSPCMDENVLRQFPRLKELYHQMEKTLVTDHPSRIDGLEDLIDDLMDEREKLTEARKVVDYLLNEAQTEIEEEIVRTRLNKTFL